MKAFLAAAVALSLSFIVSPTSAADLSLRRLQFTPVGNAQGSFRPVQMGPQNAAGPWGVPGQGNDLRVPGGGFGLQGNGVAAPGVGIGMEAAIPAGGNGARANEADTTGSAAGPGTVVPAGPGTVVPATGATSDIPPGQPTIMVLLPDFLAGSGSRSTVDVGATEKPKEDTPTPASSATVASLGLAVMAVATIATTLM